MVKERKTIDRRKHPRFIKRLTTTLLVDQKSFAGISGDLSESGLFIRTNRSFAENTPVDITILMPDNRISSLKGSVRRTHISPLKTGIGIEIIEKDEIFEDLVKSIREGRGDDTAGGNAVPQMQTISHLHNAGERKNSKNAVREKRRHKRFEVKHMKVGSEMPATDEVKIINISMSGALLKADRRLDIGNKYALKVGYKGKAMFVKAVVIWSLLADGIEDAKGKIKPVYLAGIQFTDVTRGKIEEIVNFIEADVQKDAVQPACGRQDINGVINLSHCSSPDGHSMEEGIDRHSHALPSRILNCTGTDSPGEIIEEIEALYDRYKNRTLGYYGILNIEDFAESEEIRKAYYRRAKELHPDRHSYLPPGTLEKLNSIFAYLTEAHEILTNSDCKEEYDKSLVSAPVELSNEDLARRKFEQGKIALWNGKLPEAEMLFHHAVYLDGSWGKYFYFYAKTLVKLEKCRDAEKAIKEALKLEPLNVDYLTEAGSIYQVMGLPQRARKNFEEALRLQPSNKKAHEGMKGLTNDNGGFRDNILNPIKTFRKIIVK
jgi:tetratricopeptide (TPR) repeat protein